MQQSDARSEVGGADLGLGTLLFGILGGPLAWALHLFVSYFLVAFGCEMGWPRGASIGVVVATVFFAGGAVAASVVSHRRWRHLGGDQAWDSALSDPRGRGGFLWIIGIVLGAIFALAILLAGSASLFVPTCSAGTA